jgi:1,4-dihydroxy-2-naphthoate octaprenyltransferase
MNIGSIFDRDTVLHLRLPFSFFLLPLFCFGISQATSIDIANTAILFLALHLFIYPASNVYNSYMDKDTGSIGGLKNPPPVTRKLYNASIIFDITGLLLSLLASWQLTLLIAVYVVFSKAYSWHGIRLKKYTLGSWLTVLVLQGGYTFMLANMAAANNYSIVWFTQKNIECMAIASLIIGGSYPLTQIYQHREDHQRGDTTLSYSLGIKGTFIFTLLFFSAGGAVAFHYFTTYYGPGHFVVFLVCLIPVMAYFLYWFAITIRDRAYADYEHTMLMNKLSSVCMTVCFITLLIIDHPVGK